MPLYNPGTHTCMVSLLYGYADGSLGFPALSKPWYSPQTEIMIIARATLKCILIYSVEKQVLAAYITVFPPKL